MIRVVVDPGVFVSALIGRRGAPPDLVVRALIGDRIGVIASPLLVAELELVLRRPRLAHYVGERTVGEFLVRVTRHTTMASDPQERPAATRDPKDDYLVALARGQDVDAIISGDRDLLEADLTNLPVWTPRHLVEQLTGN